MSAPAGSSPFAKDEAQVSAGTLGLRFFLVSLAILFGACVLGYWVIRLGAGRDAALDLPALPRGLWISTAILVASSGTMQWALTSIRNNRPRQLQLGMLATTLLGLAFLVVQTRCWVQWAAPLAAAISQSQTRFLLTGFYVLTGTHALHVIGGLMPLAIVTLRAARGRYSPSFHPGVRYCTMYWHFLDGVWLVLFATLLLGT
ncbi:MAG: heme-copper oxidase subunit III [Phycisphaerales bacterium]